MNKKVQIIQGTPFETGSKVWQQMVLPCLAATKGQPKSSIGSFYMGVLSALAGSMTADFDSDSVAKALRQVADEVETLSQNNQLDSNIH